MPTRPAGPRDSQLLAELVLGGLVGLLLLAAGALWIPIAVAHPPGYTEGNPIAVAVALAKGTIVWTTGCTLIALAELLVLSLLVAAGIVAWVKWRGRHSRVDDAAGHMADPDDVAHLGPAAVTAAAHRLSPALTDGDQVPPEHTGVLIGNTLTGNMPLRQSWEDMAVDIWGPRTGKTTARAIPAVVSTPGPVLVTSTKGDIVDATRDLRASRGRVWIFDPQHILSPAQRLWWNPLRGITTITDARRLAEHFAAGEREPGMSRDAFFDPSSEELVANLLLAAAIADRSVLDAFRWAVNPREDEPAMLLRANGFDLPADGITGVINMPDKTRGGIYAGAQKMLICLTEPAVTAWVTPDPAAATDEFDPAAFVASTDALYLLSEGGPGSPAPLIAALTDRVLRTGETRARTSRGRRLDPPLLAVLDEAANICRIRQLPALYSYYGSHGLPIITILQSYAQGIDVWGREGMRKLWSAANIRTYGGGVADPDFLEELSRLIGEHEVITRSTSTTGIGWGDRSISHASRRQRILDVADLHALPRGRMVVFSSGAPPVLARTIPWQHSPYAAAIQASIAHWDPDGQPDTDPPPEPNHDLPSA